MPLWTQLEDNTFAMLVPGGMVIRNDQAIWKEGGPIGFSGSMVFVSCGVPGTGGTTSAFKWINEVRHTPHEES